MPKILGLILLALLVMVMFNPFARNFMRELIHGDKVELREERLIGAVLGYNPRVKEIQEILKGAGFYPGLPDGVMGSQTRMAIKKFQKARGLKVTGKVDSTTQLTLLRERRAGLKRDKKTSEIQDEVLNHRLKSKGRVRQIQIALKKSGFYAGEVDGKTGPHTKRAIKNFQKANGLSPTGIVGQKTWDKLSKYLSN